MHFESILSKVASQVFTAPSLDEAKRLIFELIEPSKIKDRDKILQQTKLQNSLIKLQKYFANALLKFEGLGSPDIYSEQT